MKIFNLISCIAFLLFAALQYNDPDPYLWIPIYLYGAILCWLAFRNKYMPAPFLIGIFIYSIYAIYKIFDKNGVIDWLTKHNAENITETMKAETPWVEESREFFGLLILIIVFIVNYIYVRKRISRGIA